VILSILQFCELIPHTVGLKLPIPIIQSILGPSNRIIMQMMIIVIKVDPSVEFWGRTLGFWLIMLLFLPLFFSNYWWIIYHQFTTVAALAVASASAYPTYFAFPINDFMSHGSHSQGSSFHQPLMQSSSFHPMVQSSPYSGSSHVISYPVWLYMN